MENRLPIKFIENLKNILKEDYEKYIDAISKDVRKSITFNASLLDEEILTKEFNKNLEKIPFVDNGFFVGDNEKISIGKEPIYHSGIVYSQEALAMMPVEAIGVEEGDIVLDVCSAPGGKSTQIGIKLNGTGLLVSNEVVSSRAGILYENISRMGFKNVVITNSDSSVLAENLYEKFDKVLVDAPCSGEGMFRKSEEARLNWNEANVKASATRQLEILTNASRCVKVGGKLVYSTCTFNLEEDEKVVANFLKNNPDFELLELPKILYNYGLKGQDIDDVETHKCLKCFPHIFEGEGQFVALLKKKGEEDFVETIKHLKSSGFVAPHKNEESLVLGEVSKIANIKNINLAKRNDKFYILPNYLIDMEKVKVLCAGVLLGEVDKKRLEPSHQFYSAFGSDFKNKVELTKEDAEKYIKGYEIETDNPNGICALTYLGASIGGGKVVNGKVKNYYPKNLRNK